MLAKGQRRARQGERGQVLILALAFIAVFGVITVAILRFGDVVGIQHVHTEATAGNDSRAEGGAAYAAADSARSDLPNCPSLKGNTEQLTMQTGDVAAYTINACDPGNTSVLGGTGHCLLCILNQTPIPPATTTSPATSVLSVTKGVTTSGGDDYINGSIGSGTKLTATASPGPPSIYVLSGASSSGCTCSPSPVKTYSIPISDPFGTLGAPSPVAGKPSGCPSWDPVKGCTQSISTGSATISPGLWTSLAISGNSSVKVTASSGVYVFTGGLTVSGQAKFTATSGVTIYLACPNYGPGGNACPSSGSVGRTGGYISFSGQGAVAVSAPGSAQYTKVGGIADVAILSDPNLLDPGGVSACVGGTGTCIYNVSGNGASVTGSIDTRSGGVAIGGNGGQTENNGLLITNSLFIGVSGGATTGLNLSGPGSVTTGSCGVFDDTVSGTASGSSTPVLGRAIIEAACGTGSTNGVVSFNYGP
jgi:hypothetical protein